MDMQGVALGMGFWMFSLLILHLLLSNPRFKLVYGMSVLFLSLLIPTVLISISWPNMLKEFLEFINSFPIIHVLLFLLSFIFIYYMMKEIRVADFMSSRTSEEVIYISMAVMASATGYYFFIMLISTFSTALAILILTSIVAILILKSSLKVRSQHLKNKYVILEQMNESFEQALKYLERSASPKATEVYELLYRAMLEVDTARKILIKKELWKIREEISVWLDILHNYGLNRISSEHQEILERQIRIWMTVIKSIE